MTTIINNHGTAGKQSLRVFTRQAGFPDAPRHASLVATLAAWLKRRRAAQELNRLSDRELADIGLTRQNIPNVLRRAR